jgi:predicted nucleic acid-binding Zn ribbon protein
MIFVVSESILSEKTIGEERRFCSDRGTFMDYGKAKLLFLMLPFLVLTVVGTTAVLLASTTVMVAGEGTIFYTPLGVPGIIAIIVGLAGLLLLWLTR